MGLVDYGSSSSSDSEPEHAAPLPASGQKRKRPQHDAPLPRLPPAFYDLYATNARVSTHDDPSLHGGRTRIAPHQAGSWPTHVYLEWLPSSNELLALQRLLCEVKNNISADPPLRDVDLISSLTDDTGAPRPLHVSLSQSLLLPTDGKDAFFDRVKKNVRNLCSHRGAGAAIRPFDLTFEDLIWAANAERTRWFLALRARRPSGNQLNRILAACNEAVASQGFPPLYSRPRADGPGHGKESLEDLTDYFHFSLAWTLSPPIPKASETAVVGLTGEALERVLSLTVPIDAVKVKIGNSVSSLALSFHGSDYRGVLG